MSDPGPPARGQPSGARVGRLTPGRRPRDTRRDDSLPVRIPPPRPRHEQPAENDPADRERDARRRWGTEERADVRQHQHRDERPEAVSPGPVTRPSGRGYSHTPATNITPSTATVPVTEFHSPSPSGVPPGYSGMSGRWVTKSSSQWLTTRSATTSAARPSPVRTR